MLLREICFSPVMVAAKKLVIEDDLEDTIDVFLPARTGEDRFPQACEPNWMPLSCCEQRDNRWTNLHTLASSIPGSGKPFANILIIGRPEVGS